MGCFKWLLLGPQEMFEIHTGIDLVILSPKLTHSFI